MGGFRFIRPFKAVSIVHMQGVSMVSIEYIANAARGQAHKPHKLIARATLRHLGIPLPQTIVRDIPRGVPVAVDGDIAECIANAASPLDGRHG